MAQTVDLDGLPEPVGKAIAETVANLKSHCGVDTVPEPVTLSAAEAERALEELLDTLPPMPSLSDRALSRESIYAPENDAR